MCYNFYLPFVLNGLLAVGRVQLCYDGIFMASESTCFGRHVAQFNK